jgi:predicted glycogen debranching enzyme
MITIGRDVCGNLDESLRREWLVTNGIGGFASGTLSGINTRRYHGLLVAALQPPTRRTLMLARVDEELVVDDRTFFLGASEYHDGTINPHGYIHLQELELDDGVPTFTYSVPDATLTKTIWMEDGQNTTYVRYKLGAAAHPVTLRLVYFVTYRDFHGTTHGALDWEFPVRDTADGVEIAAYPEAIPLRLRSQPATRFVQTGVWYWKNLLRRERERGLDSLEDLYTPGLMITTLEPGATFTIQASAEDWSALPSELGHALDRRRDRQRRLWSGAKFTLDPPELKDLVVAADQFVVRRPDALSPTGSTYGIIAGYHWFEEWGRDALIAMPGLLLSTSRIQEARELLLRYAALADHGQIPNRLPDNDQPAEYNSVDAALWLFQALEHYLDATRDDELLAQLFPLMADIGRWYSEGTRFGIEVDENDSLLQSGVDGVQLTWMDAKVGSWVVTPRRGKAVEVNALWYNALRLLDGWSRRLDRPADRYREHAREVYESFNSAFWYPEGGYLYDVVDGPNGEPDASLRPNQLFAIGLVYPTLDPRRWESVLAQVERALITPVGLRTLAPGALGYVGRYGGDQLHRDAAYHQGTAWPWLLGVYADACRRASRDPSLARAALDRLLADRASYGIGTIGEIFDGDLPHAPSGCIAQAWSVAETLRAWRRVNQE